MVNKEEKAKTNKKNLSSYR